MDATAATWAGFAMAVLSLAGTIAANFNARRLAADKAEFERLAAKDKQDFELKVMEIQKDAERKDEDLAEMRAELAKCREQHTAAEVRMGESETDRQAMRERIAELEKQIQMLADR